MKVSLVFIGSDERIISGVNRIAWKSKPNSNIETRKWACYNVWVHIMQRRWKSGSGWWDCEPAHLSANFEIPPTKYPKHKPHIERSWLLYNCTNVIDTPAQSIHNVHPHSIENWYSEVDRSVYQNPVSSLIALKTRLQEKWEWNKIGSDYTSKMISNMSNLLSEVIKKRQYPKILITWCTVQIMCYNQAEN